MEEARYAPLHGRVVLKRSGALILASASLAGCIPNTGSYAPAYPDPPAQQPYRSPVTTPRPPQAAPTTPAPSTRPLWEARRVTADARLVSASTYVVQPGDTLRAIANKSGAGADAIAQANGLRAPYTIRAGQRLSIPGGRYHQVREGETGIAIARAYGVEWSRMINANGLEEPYLIRVGQRLLIPSAGAESLEERAARFHIDIDDIVTGSSPAAPENARPAPAPVAPVRPLAENKPIAVPSRMSGQFQWPVNGNVVRKFGPGRSGERNDGIKIAVPLKTPVQAAADGVVAYVGSDIPALGGLIILSHGDGWTTVYGHTSDLLVQRGQAVKRGQTIARSGNSGFADRPQLHFEMRKGRNAVDPQPNLPAR